MEQNSEHMIGQLEQNSEHMIGQLIALTNQKREGKQELKKKSQNLLRVRAELGVYSTRTCTVLPGWLIATRTVPSYESTFV